MSAQPGSAAQKNPVVAPAKGLFGIAPEFVRDPLRLLTELAQLGEVVALPMGIATAYLLTHPEHVLRVLQNHKQFGRAIPSYQRLRAVLGDGLLVSEGDFWLRQRRTAQPAFHKERIAGFAAAMVQATCDAVERLRHVAAAADPRGVDVAEELTRLTMQIVCTTLLGADAQREGAQAAQAFAVLNELTTRRILKLWAPPLWLPTSENRRYRRALAVLDGAIYELIARRRAAADKSNDLLSMLLLARDPETGEGMSDRQVRDEVATIFVAGHETTAVALTWTLHLLSQHPEVEARLRADLSRVLGSRLPTLSDLENLPYLRMVIEESMRLYPPVYCTTRGLVSDEDLDGYQLPKGSMILASQWVLHRLPALWPEPLRFDPERFSAERRECIPRGAYFPFIAGPRQCIGNVFALVEAQLILATLLSRIALRPAKDQPAVEPVPLMTLRPRQGLWMVPSVL